MTETTLEANIREAAYRKWVSAGTPPGDGVKFWLEAEAEVKKGGTTTLKEDNDCTVRMKVGDNFINVPLEG